MDALDMMLRYSARPEASGPDLSGWPADVVEVLQACFEIWGLMPSERKKAKWIKDARDMKEACTGFKMWELIDVTHNDWKERMKANRGIAPYTYKDIGSLVGPVAGMAAMLRAMAGEAAEDRQRYVEGEYASWIEH